LVSWADRGQEDIEASGLSGDDALHKPQGGGALVFLGAEHLEVQQEPEVRADQLEDDRAVIVLDALASIDRNLALLALRAAPLVAGVDFVAVNGGEAMAEKGCEHLFAPQLAIPARSLLLEPLAPCVGVGVRPAPSGRAFPILTLGSNFGTFKRMTTPTMADPGKNELSLVSIIIPVYNAASYLTRCVDSILGQEYSQFELLLIDDGSTDGSGAMCDDAMRRDKRVHVVHLQNGGPALARNTGIAQAVGDYIFFVDADDWIVPEALKTLLGGFQGDEIDLVVGDFLKTRNNQPEECVPSGHEAYFPTTRRMDTRDLLDYTQTYLKKPNRSPLFVYSWGRLFRASVIKTHQLAFNSGLRTFEDVSFNYNFLKHARAIVFVNRVVYQHLVHDNYASASMAMEGDPSILFGYKAALVSAGEYLVQVDPGRDWSKELGHAYVTYTIIQFVRVCGQVGDGNRKAILALVRSIIREPKCRVSLPHYAPTKGDSRVLPLLMKLKLAGLIIRVCQYKANKRYGKKGVRK
jgi:glycosyltransferase involved in cell wall biosynthesis